MPALFGPAKAELNGMDAKLKAETTLAHGPNPNFDQTVTGLKKSMNAAASSGGQTRTTAAQSTATYGMEKVMRTTEDMMAIGQGNLDATIQFGQTMMNGFQDLSRQTVATLQARADEAGTLVRALAGAKSLHEAMEVQSNLGRANMEKAVSEFSKLTEASFNVFQQAMAPLTQQITRASERFSRAA